VPGEGAIAFLKTISAFSGSSQDGYGIGLSLLYQLALFELWARLG
jgi:hypothetical protein